ncbi:MAG: conjugal transfer protein TraD [Faecalibacterium sp.]|nr:conjugal transfer protein TraD [Faecalibacterium sp.]
MNPNLKFTRRTWYFLLLISAACSLLNALAVLAGHNLTFLEQLAFGGTGLAVLFLAAEKSNPPAGRKAYFGVFVLLLLSYMFGGAVGLVFSALVWPMLLLIERRRGLPVDHSLRLVLFAEAMHTALVIMTLAGLPTALFANLFWVLTAAARGSAALVLYRVRPEMEE